MTSKVPKNKDEQLIWRQCVMQFLVGATISICSTVPVNCLQRQLVNVKLCFCRNWLPAGDKVVNSEMAKWKCATRWTLLYWPLGMLMREAVRDHPWRPVDCLSRVSLYFEWMIARTALLRLSLRCLSSTSITPYHLLISTVQSAGLPCLVRVGQLI